jgi:hypothetical protein
MALLRMSAEYDITDMCQLVDTECAGEIRRVARRDIKQDARDFEAVGKFKRPVVGPGQCFQLRPEYRVECRS